MKQKSKKNKEGKEEKIQLPDAVNVPTHAQSGSQAKYKKHNKKL